jgi:hypothetical protein
VVPGLRLAQRRAPWPAHVQLVAAIYRLTANPPEDIAAHLPDAHPVQEVAVRPAYQMLSHVGTVALAGCIEWPHALARDLHMEADGLLRLAEAASLLGIATGVEGACGYMLSFRSHRRHLC